MKTIRQRLLPLRRLPLPPQLVHDQIPAIGTPFSSSSSSSSVYDSAASKINTTLTQDELTKISLLLPRLCLYNHHSTAITLLDTALLTNLSLQSLPLSILSHSLASQSDFALTMSLLTRLKHHRNALLYSSPIITMLIFSYSKQRKSKEALKIFHWMLRPGSPCKPDEMVYKTLIAGLCRKGMVLDALKILKNMIDSNLVPDYDLRSWVCMCLLREAMIGEATELSETLNSIADRNISDHLRKVSELLDRVINNWIE
ncbi:pentatricopeptide repeat-containing protein At3g22470, mitochondrial-like [Cucurbita maxima]|uniref:Pentatricopeptide repeat-containing protein At3g22470, mitochondrial-like n=1 Tax=Cucurbita maxima TaxID=3661 RepID=A0A6J1KEJ7_CUCMA|nr:pentatricopeptide repeat-containing protein At3g22470, mitochondrial-like [Cucurbita maxima]XP_023000756.1 pentatricopeptide repeat-containing protein At3g22470, mitochondrial-like [Cucurbita maxima]XP_023000757.1 pentatricopeptide repeat-containing protein At3g22470, mitochondrial-like [Cucurbita maxima]